MNTRIVIITYLILIILYLLLLYNIIIYIIGLVLLFFPFYSYYINFDNSTLAYKFKKYFIEYKNYLSIIFILLLFSIVLRFPVSLLILYVIIPYILYLNFKGTKSKKIFNDIKFQEIFNKLLKNSTTYIFLMLFSLFLIVLPYLLSFFTWILRGEIGMIGIIGIITIPLGFITLIISLILYIITKKNQNE